MKSPVQQFIAAVKELRDGLLEIPRRLSALDQDIKQQTEAIHEARNAYTEGRDSPPVLRAELQVPQPIEVKTSPTQKKEGREWFKLVVETATLLTVLAYTVITGRVLKTTQGSVQQVHRQIAMEHRAWLLLNTDYTDTFRAKSNIVEIPVSLTNIGKSPAEHIQGSIEVDEVPQSNIAAHDFAPGQSWNAIKAALIYPGFPHTTKVFEWAAKDKPVKVDARKREMFLKGDIIFVIQGRITYDDVFHVHHWLDFCHAISANPAGHAQRCVDKNRIDPYDE